MLYKKLKAALSIPHVLLKRRFFTRVDGTLTTLEFEPFLNASSIQAQHFPPEPTLLCLSLHPHPSQCESTLPTPFRPDPVHTKALVDPRAPLTPEVRLHCKAQG